MAAGGNYEHVALTLYQCGTLQYTMGKYQQAAESLRMSLKTVRQHYPEAGEQVSLRGEGWFRIVDGFSTAGVLCGGGGLCAAVPCSLADMVRVE